MTPSKGRRKRKKIMIETISQAVASQPVPPPIPEKKHRQKSTVPTFGGRIRPKVAQTSILFVIPFPVRTPFGDLQKHISERLKAAKAAGIQTPEFVEGRIEFLATVKDED